MINLRQYAYTTTPTKASTVDNAGTRNVPKVVLTAGYDSAETGQPGRQLGDDAYTMRGTNS